MNRVVLITGASSGFGKASARKFGKAGCSLILAARNAEKLAELADELKTHCSVHVAQLDVTKSESVDSLIADLPDNFRNIDVLLNSAGLALGVEPAYEVNFSDWETMIETNITGLLRVTHAILPSMVTRNTGHIINIGSTAGSWPYPGGNTYGATKSFVQNFSRALRADLLGKSIRVTNIDPGMSETNFSNVRFKGDAQKADKVYEGTQPLTAEDVAEMVFWVNSMPAHVNINTLEAMPVCQAWAPLAVHRGMYES